MNNLKENTTFGITSGGAFLKTLIIGKGITSICLNKYNLNNEFINACDKKGRADENCILLILNQISNVTKNENSILIMDQYGSHKT